MDKNIKKKLTIISSINLFNITFINKLIIKTIKQVGFRRQLVFY